MLQPSLFTATRKVRIPYAPGSDTSKAAADRMQPFVGPQGERVYAYLERRGRRGATQKEAQQEMPIGQSSACGRFNALERAGRIRKIEERRGGCRVYRVTEIEAY